MARAAVLERLISTQDPLPPIPGPQTPAEHEAPPSSAAVGSSGPLDGAESSGEGPPLAPDESPDAPPGRPSVDWRLVTVVETIRETPRTTTLVVDAPGWPGHRAGQHVDVRLTAEDGYQAQRSYSIASPPEDDALRVTVDRLEDGEVSPFLVDDVLAGDELELRGPIGGPFTWSVDDGGPLLLLAGGSGIVPLMAMLRHRAARGSEVPARLLHSVRAPRDAIFRRELLGLTSPMAAGPGGTSLDVRWTFTRAAPPDWDGFSGRVDAAMLEAFLDEDPSPSAGPPSLAGAPGGAFASAAPPASAGPRRPDGSPGARTTAPDPATRAFVCGPTPFVETVAALLVDRGHDPARVHTERFGPS